MIHRAILMAIPCVAGFNAWRFLHEPGDPWAISTYAAGSAAILLAMAALRFRVPDAAFTLAGLLALLSAFSIANGDPTMARVMCGGILVVLTLVAADAAEDAFDRAMARGIGLTLLAWGLGNTYRGNFGPDIALSALGQAFGAWGDPALWAAIIVLYAWAWYNREANNHA